MGTNYYLHIDVCPTCGRSADQIHIGKSSCGWRFSLHVSQGAWEEIPRNLDEWRESWKLGVIKNEYDQVITPGQMLRIIKHRGQYIPANNREGLSYHPVDGFCIANAEDGDYDLLVGEFS